MRKQLFTIMLAFAYAFTSAQTSTINKEPYYIENYGDSTDQVAQAASYNGNAPINFIGYKVMWLNNFANSNLLSRSGYGGLEVDDVKPPVSKWTITQNAFIGNEHFTPGKIFVTAYIDKNERITKCIITSTSDNMLIDLYSYYWPNGIYDKVTFNKTLKAEKMYKLDAITLTRVNGKLKIIIAPGALTATKK